MAQPKSNTPKQLQKSAKAAAKEYEEIYGKKANDEDAAAAEAATPPAPAKEEAPTPAEVVNIKPDEKTVDWEQKYRTLDGKYTAEVPRLQRENASLNARVIGFEDKLTALEKAQEEATAAPQTPTGELLKPEEIEDYGADMISVVKRAAREEFTPELEKLRKENAELKGELGHVETTISTNTQASLFETMDEKLPAWRELNTKPEFLDWLGQPDVYSGLTRQEMLTNAFDVKDANRVIKFFKGFLAEQTSETPAPTPAPQEEPQGSTLDTLVAPGRPKGSTDNSGAPSEHIWTEASIAQYYRDVQKGVFKGRKAEKEALERDIFKAMKDGRIVG